MLDAKPGNLRVGIIGAGPAGLTAAYILSKAGISVEVLEADPIYVGGISRTVQYKGFRFDIGGHRFFSKSQEVESLWSEILPDDIIVRPRSSRLLYGGKFYSYPLQALEVLNNLGIWQSFLCFGSYCRVKLRYNLGLIRSPENFEEWVVYNFGWRLYFAFFKAYTEKVWGIPCTEISADWAVQRIKGLSLLTTAINILRSAINSKPRNRGAKQIKTLIKSFRYPRLGPGMMWEAAKEKIVSNHGRVIHGVRVTSLHRQQASGQWYLNVNETKGHSRPDEQDDGSKPSRFGPYHHVGTPEKVRSTAAQLVSAIKTL
jgi:protoporphyrinogen oxidase